MPQSWSANRALRCVKLSVAGMINMIIMFIIFEGRKIIIITCFQHTEQQKTHHTVNIGGNFKD
jgi:hypothetical protein